MAEGRKLRISVDNPSEKDRRVDRMMALADRRGDSMNALVLEAIRQYVEREEKEGPSPEDQLQTQLLRVAANSASMLETVTRVIELTKGRVDALERVADMHERVLMNVVTQMEAVSSDLFDLVEKANPQWTPEERNRRYQRLSARDEKTPTGSLFQAGRGSDGPQG
jgi:hypothetical protein